MFNITMRKVGGIRFIAIGRINLSISVSTATAYNAKATARLHKLETRCENEAMRALVAALS